MSTRRPAEKPLDPEPADAGKDPDMDAVEDEADQLDEMSNMVEAYEADTKRLEAYGDVLEILAAANGLPVLGGADNAVVASQSCVNVAARVAKKAERTLLAVLDDIHRIATNPGQTLVKTPMREQA